MIITCPSCKKKFEIDQKLIPLEGRMLQCGSCDRQWFFKINVPEKKIVNEEDTKSPTTVNNALFVGSTAELSKLLKSSSKGDS